MPISTYNLPSTNSNRPYRLYMGTTPIRGAFRYKYDSTNIKDGHYQVYPNIYTIQLSNYSSQKGGATKYYDNIRIELYDPQNIYTTGYYTIACNDSVAVSIVTQFSQYVQLKISHANSNDPEYVFDYLPVDIYLLLNVFPYANKAPFENYVYDTNHNYFLSRYMTPPNDYMVLKIPSGTHIGDSYVNIFPNDDLASLIQVVGSTGKDYGNVDFFDAVWSQYNYAGSTFGVDANEFGGNNWHAQVPGAQGRFYLSLRGASTIRPDTFLYTVNHQKRFTTEAQLKSFFNSVLELTGSLYSDMISDAPNVYTAPNGYHFSLNQPMQQGDGNIYSKGVWFNTTIDRGYNSTNTIIDYNDDVIYERNDLLASQLYLTYSTNGAWYQTLNGTTYATYSFNGAYYKPTSYTTYQTWGSYSDSGQCRVEVSTSGSPPASQTLVTYINTFKYIQFPVPDTYSDVKDYDISYTNAYSVLGNYFYGYLTAPAVANTYIPNERYKGTYIFDFNEDNYITRFRYTIGTGCRWTSQRFFNSFAWYNRPASPSNPFGTYMNYSFGSLRATGAGYHTSLVWFYIWGVTKGKTVKCNDTTVTGVSSGGEPPWHDYHNWVWSVDGTDYHPRVGSDIKSSVTFSAPSSGGWQISGITINVSSIKLYDINVNFTITAETNGTSASGRYYNIVTNGSNSQSTPESPINWSTQIDPPSGLNQIKEFDIYVMFKVLGSESANRNQEIWCTKLNNTNSSNGSNNSWIIRVSEPDTYKYKWLKLD